MLTKVGVYFFIVMLEFSFQSPGLPNECLFLVIPEDVPAGFAAIYGFAPQLHKGNDHRLGFGFRFGNHADFQILYEFGPQTITKPLQQPSKIRSTSNRQRFVRRRPVLELLIRAGILKDTSYESNVIHDCDYEPR